MTDWREELKLAANKRTAAHKFRTNKIETLWSQLTALASELAPDIRPRIEKDKIFMSNPSSRTVLIFYGSWISRVDNYMINSDFNQSQYIITGFNPCITENICIEGNLYPHISHRIKDGDAEIILRNHLMNYPTFTDLEPDYVWDRENGVWLPKKDYEQIQQSKIDRVNKIFGTNYQIGK